MDNHLVATYIRSCNSLVLVLSLNLELDSILLFLPRVFTPFRSIHSIAIYKIPSIALRYQLVPV